MRTPLAGIASLSIAYATNAASNGFSVADGRRASSTPLHSARAPWPARSVLSLVETPGSETKTRLRLGKRRRMGEHRAP